MKNMQKKIIFVIVFTIIISAVFYLLYGIFFNPRRGEVKNIQKSMPLEHVLQRDEIIEDVLYLYDKLKNHHPAWIEKNNANIEKINTILLAYSEGPADTITTLQLWRDLSSIISLIHDGHTKISWKNPENDLYIHDFAIPEKYGKPIKINYQNIDEILSEYLCLASYEYDFYAIRRFYDSSLYTKHSLDFLGVDTSKGVTFTYREKGIPVNFYFEFVPYKDVKKAEDKTTSNSWVYFTIDDVESLGILTLKTCDLNDDYKCVLDSFFSEVRNRSIKHVAVDLRGNGGGNSGVANAFLRYINIDSYNSWDSAVRYGPILWENKNIVINNKKMDNPFSGFLYVLTDVYSYSSAMDFAMLIKDNNLGLIIGEASGNSPDSYGDNLYFQMPNSKLYFTLSHKKWYRINKDKSGLPIEPDYECASADAIKTLYKIISADSRG